PIFAGRLSAARRRRIRRSRIDSTAALVRALAELPESRRPRVLVCASAVGFYGDRGEERLDEDSAPGTGFLSEICCDWEAAAGGGREHGVRVVQLRLGVVLAREGGALSRMATAFRMGAGGRLGSGRQWFSWIHIDDAVALILSVLADPCYSGPVNATAPEPVRNAELTRALARQLRRPALLPVPAFALRAALGELSGELLGSRHVTPARALAAGFEFALPELGLALTRELGGGPRESGFSGRRSSA
ncbi:MAG: TIGR01777 family oxidoreductase, partial [Myxococcota bacterium]